MCLVHILCKAYDWILDLLLCVTKNQIWNIFSNLLCFPEAEIKSEIFFQNLIVFFKQKSYLNYFSKPHCFLRTKNQIWIISYISFFVFQNQKLDLKLFFKSPLLPKNKNQVWIYFSNLLYFPKPKIRSKFIFQISIVSKTKNHI